MNKGRWVISLFSIHFTSFLLCFSSTFASTLISPPQFLSINLHFSSNFTSMLLFR
uniref:Uncharacterized protein n=1 Tax=Solanum lycopersicum TaxID=4081 RepID=A0A494G8B3_SOLLC